MGIFDFLFGNKFNRYHDEGQKFFMDGRYIEAIISFDKAIAINPDNAAVWSSRGFALNKLGRYAEAVAAYDKVIDIYPNTADAEAKQNREIALKKQI